MADPHKWDDLRYVLAVADAGSVNAAASTLGVNHATILRRIASFEAAHSISVFQKSATGYRVSDEFQPIIEAIRGVNASVDALERVIAGKGERLDGVVRMTSTDSLCRTVLPPILRNFHQAHPDLTIALSATNARLNLSKLDAEITVRPAKTLPPDLTGHKVARMEFRVFGTANYLSRHPSGNPASHRWLGVTELLARSPVGAWQANLPGDQIVFKADSFVTLADVAETGLGLAMLPDCLGVFSETLTPAPQFPDTLETFIWVATHHDLAASPRIQACAEFLESELSRASGLSH